MRKLFITFEGGDKCGKSTQIALLAKHLKKKKLPVRVFREPGATKLGERIREILLHRHDYKLSPFVEFQLFTTARRQLTEEVLVPFLKKGKGALILDRFFDSTIVYQGAAGGVDLKKYESYERSSRADITPDVTFLLDLPLAEAKKRGSRFKKDRMEKKSALFHERVRKGFLKLAEENKRRFVVLNAAKDIQTLHKEILKTLEERFGRI